MHASLDDVQSHHDDQMKKLRDCEWLERCIVPAMDADNVLGLMANIRDVLFERFTFDRFGILIGTLNDQFCRIHEIVTRDGMEACLQGSLMRVKSTGLEWIYNNRELHYNPDLQNNQEFIEDPELASIDLRSLVRVPLVRRDEVFGVMTIKSVEPHRYSEEDLNVIRRVAYRLTASIYSLKLIYTLREASYKDPLTGALNRRFLTEVMSNQDKNLLEEIIGLSVEKTEHVGLMFVDLDEFKLFNDHYGHLAGDARLAEVTELLVQAIKGHGFVARYGGDEFLTVIPGATEETMTHVKQAIESEVTRFNESFESEPHRALKLSLGAVTGDWAAFEHLIRSADMAMYATKRDNWEFQRTLRT